MLIPVALTYISQSGLDFLCSFLFVLKVRRPVVSQESENAADQKACPGVLTVVQALDESRFHWALSHISHGLLSQYDTYSVVLKGWSGLE